MLNADPDHADAANNLATAYRRQAKFAEAAEAMNRALASPRINAQQSKVFPQRLQEYQRLVQISKAVTKPLNLDEAIQQGIEGHLSADDPLDVFPATWSSHRKSHRVELHAGTSYQIDLSTTSMPFFALRMRPTTGPWSTTMTFTRAI